MAYPLLVNRLAVVLIVATMVALSAGCGTTHTTSSTQAKRSGTPSVPAGPGTAEEQKAAAVHKEAAHLTGVGAVESVFNENHALQTTAKNAGLVRGVDSVSTDGRGRVRVYTVEFNVHPSPSLRVAAQEVGQLELPNDAVLIATHRTQSCAQRIYTSRVLRDALGVSTLLVEFQSTSEKEGTFDPSAVTSATLTSVMNATQVPC